MKNLSIFKRTLLIFLSISLITLLTMIIVSNTIFSNATIKTIDLTFENDLLRKKNEIEKYFKTTEADIETMADFFAVQELFEKLNVFFENTGTQKTKSYTNQSDKYKNLTSKYHSYFNKYINEHDFADILFISPQGHIMFSIARGDDFGTNLEKGKYKNTLLADLWKTTTTEGKTVITDYQKYSSFNNQQISFVGTPVYTNEKLVGTLVVLLTFQNIDDIVKVADNLYKTTDTYIVSNAGNGKFELKSGQDKKDGLNGEDIKSDIFQKCIIEKQSGKQIQEDTDNNLIYYTYYTPLNIIDLEYGLIKVVSENEVLMPLKIGKKTLIIISTLHDDFYFL